MAQVVVSGLLFGMVYALVAMGFSLVYRMTRVLNFAAGDLLMLGGFIGFSLYVQLRWPFIAVILTSSLAVGLLMVIVDRLALAPAYRRSGVAATVSTIGLAFALQNGAQLFWGNLGLSFPTVFGNNPVPVFGVLIVPEMVALFLIGSIGIVILTLFMTRSRLGVAMRAVAGDPVMARLVGINVERTKSLSFFIAGALGGIAGVLLAPITLLTTTMGTALGIKGFVAALIGGLGNLPGAVVGGLLLGLLETLVGAYLDPSWTDGIVFAIVVVLLLLRPFGIFGEEGIEEGR
jgi:branched-chain amino acid transport system permease protein